jgi:hypothetical protein
VSVVFSNGGEIRTGIARFIRRGGRLPRLHRRGPFQDSLPALATKTRTGRYVVAWWRRPQARKERSSPTLPSPAGRHQTSDDGHSIARVGYVAGNLIVPSRRPGAHVSRLRSVAALRLEPGTSKARPEDFFAQQDRQQQWPGGSLSKSNASSAQGEAGVMKGWFCIDFVFIQPSLTGLPQPRTGRQFIAWRRQPQESRPDQR